MKRSTWDGAVVVYRYGCPSWAALDEECMQQLWLAHDWRNELVRIQRRWEAMAAALWLSIPQVAAAQNVADAAADDLAAVKTDAKAQRIRGRSTIADPDIKRQLAAARQAHKDAKAAVKTAKEHHKAWYQQLRAELDAAKRCASGDCTSSHRCNRVDCRPGCHHNCPHPDEPRVYDQWAGRGLGHGTWGRRRDEHRTAVAQVIAARTAGQPAEHRIHPWRGEGTLTVQIGYGAKTNESWWSLGEGRPAKEWLGGDRRVHEQTAGTRQTLRLRIGRSRGFDPLWLELPVVVHRPLPPAGQVRWVSVTRRVLGGRPQLSVQFTVWLPAPPAKTDGEVIDLDLRWTSDGTAGTRVARLSTASGAMPSPPADIADLVAYGDWLEVWAPAVWRDLLGRDDAIRADRDVLLDKLRPAVVEALGDDPVLATTVGFTAAAARLMGFAKYGRLARRWPAEHPLAAEVASWRARDRHLWLYESNERQQVVARRRDAYRKVAAWICDAARVIAVKDVDVADLRRRPDVGDEDTYQARGSRRNVQYAAPADFRAAVLNAAQRRGVQVLTYSEGTDGD